MVTKDYRLGVQTSLAAQQPGLPDTGGFRGQVSGGMLFFRPTGRNITNSHSGWRMHRGAG